ncbi:MAG: DUF2927 domain-containing protein [Longimicrobiales bacterium]|nr:DUF2927 domain-containing protein [Longimicrobiales bacterium]
MWQRRAWLVGAALLFAACGDAGPETVLEITPPASTEVMVGDLLLLAAVASGPTGFMDWTTSDPSVAMVSGGLVEALRPGPVVIEVSAAGAVPDQIGLTVVPRPGGYDAAEIDYFAEVAFGAEFGGATPLLRRWRTAPGPQIRINGSPTPADLEMVDSVVAEMNRLTPLDIQMVEDAPTVEMHFVPQDDFSQILPDAPDGNIGLVWVWWASDQYLFESVVLIATDVAEDRRLHIIREELTQMLGLLRDSFRYPESIFYQNFSTVTEYLPIGRTVIELLYRPELEVGMPELTAKRIARRLLRDGGMDPPGSALARSGAEGDGSRVSGDAPAVGAPGAAGGGGR